MLKVFFASLRAVLALNPLAGFGLDVKDGNKNGTLDVTLKLYLKDGKSTQLGPIDIPGASLEKLVETAEDALT